MRQHGGGGGVGQNSTRSEVKWTTQLLLLRSEFGGTSSGQDGGRTLSRIRPTGKRKLRGSAEAEAGAGGTAGVLTCIRAPGVAPDSQVIELLAPVAGVGISDPGTEV